MATLSEPCSTCNPVKFVCSDPKQAPPGFGAGTLAAMMDYGAVALVIHPTRQPELRLRLSRAAADALAAQLSDAAAALHRETGL